MTRGWKVCLWILAVASLRTSAQIAAPGIGGVVSSISAQNSQVGQEPHTLRGTVVNSVTGEPINRALVQLGGQFATLTDHEGHFEFEGVTEATTNQWAMKPGYFSEPRMQRYSASTQSGDQPFIVKLVPEAVLSGTVTGQDGGPLEGIPVQLKTLAVSNGMLRWQSRQGTQTNSEGQYRFYELQAGKYAVVTGFHPEGMADEKNSVAYIPVRYPAVGGTEAQAAIQLNAGDHREVNLSPETEKLYPVTGVVNGYGESRGVSFHVETADGEEISAASHFNARTSEFRLQLPGGTYSVTATAYVQRGSLESRLQITVPQAPVSGVSFALEPGAVIPVDVEVESVSQSSSQTGGPQDGAGQTPSAYISLLATDSSGASYPAMEPGGRGRGGTGNAAGPLTIQNAPPGRYVLQVQPSNGAYYVSSASCGGVDLTHEELAIANGAAGCSIRVVLRDDSGSVHVTERSSDSNEQSMVFLYPLGDFVRHWQQGGGTDFTFQQVPPGRYLAVAQDHQEELPYRDPEAMRRYAGLGQEVSVSSNTVTNVEVSPVHVEP
jgi:hypothetical protein